MVNRILAVMRMKNLTPSQFADEIGIQRSGMSHIISGRNKPSLEFVMKILQRYPDIKPEWLLTGSVPKTESAGEPVSANPVSPLTLFEDNEDQPVSPAGPGYNQVPGSRPVNSNARAGDMISSQDSGYTQAAPIPPVSSNTSPTSAMPEGQCESQTPAIKQNTKNYAPTSDGLGGPTTGKKIDRIVIFYADRTFMEYKPDFENT